MVNLKVESGVFVIYIYILYFKLIINFEKKNYLALKFNNFNFNQISNKLHLKSSSLKLNHAK